MSYVINMSLKVDNIRKIKKGVDSFAKHMDDIKREFVKESLEYIEAKARLNIQATTGGSWYEPTGTLENSWVLSVDTGILENLCYYAALVEYGTGIVGSGTHPAPGSYKYDVNGHGESGWFFADAQGNVHWTKGMKAHRFLYDAINEYILSGEYRNIFKRATQKYMEKDFGKI